MDRVCSNLIYSMCSIPSAGEAQVFPFLRSTPSPSPSERGLGEGDATVEVNEKTGSDSRPPYPRPLSRRNGRGEIMR